jgi:L,D-transpeptidase ErfK/SrfK
MAAKAIMAAIPIMAAIIVMAAIPSPAYASGAFSLNDPSRSLIGAGQTYFVKNDETLMDVAVEYDVGYNAIAEANRDIDPWVPDKGQEVALPTQWLLPDVMDEGILINLAEMRLYHFFKTHTGDRFVETFPIGIGVEGFKTPTGTYHITAKIKDPVWRVPQHVRDENPERPALVPPGPDNPLGTHWLQLSISGYGIHGTIKPLGVGRRVSSGCIRLYPEDIITLFRFVGVGTKVMIVDEPVKVGKYKGKVYIEIHSNGFDEDKLHSDGFDEDKLKKLAIKKLGEKNLLGDIDTELLTSAVKSQSGLPTVISATLSTTP